MAIRTGHIKKALRSTMVRLLLLLQQSEQIRRGNDTLKGIKKTSRQFQSTDLIGRSKKNTNEIDSKDKNFCHLFTFESAII